MGKSVEMKQRWVYALVSVAGLALIAAVWLFQQSRGAAPAASDTASVPSQRPVQLDSLRKQEAIDDVNRALSQRPAILREPIAREIVAKVPPATTTGFELIEHSVVTDLRSFKSVPSVDRRAGLMSPVVQTVTQTIKKTGESNAYLLRAHTSGFDVYSRSASHEDKLIVHASEERTDVAAYSVRPRVLEFDLTGEPKQQEFLLQVSKTYWQAFQNDDQSWVGVRVGLPTRSISYVVLFPEDKPFTEFEHFVNDSGSNRIALPDETFVLADPQKRWIWWKIVNPQPGYGYNIDWEW